MEVLLVGAEKDRARVRAILPANVHVAAEASTLEDAGADDHGVDAWVFAPAAAAYRPRRTSRSNR